MTGFWRRKERKSAENLSIEFIGTGSDLSLRKARRMDLEDMGRKVNRENPGVKMRNPRFFRSTNLIGSFQNDGVRKDSKSDRKSGKRRRDSSLRSQ
jgi:hypothetical protein